MVPARFAARFPALIAIVAAVLLALPATALAADPVTVSGTVVREGAPVTGAQVVVTVTGSDQIVAATTDEQGAFSVELAADPGAEVRIDVTGQTSRSEPDAKNCVRLETPSGSLTFTLGEGQPEAVQVPMDEVLTGTVCGPTPTPRVTPPSTDAPVAAAGHVSTAGLLLVLGVLALLGAGILATARRWR